jgi:pimeloyl-ACP methyl ester carboxylesterase
VHVVERLVLLSPLVPMESSERSWLFTLAAIPGVGETMFGAVDHLPTMPGFSDAYRERARAVFRRAGTRRALLRYARRGRDEARLFATYRHIVAPTLLVYGTKDDLVPWTATRRTAPAIRDVLVLPIEGAGHWLMRDERARVLEAIAAFLRSSGAPA